MATCNKEVYYRDGRNIMWQVAARYLSLREVGIVFAPPGMRPGTAGAFPRLGFLRRPAIYITHPRPKVNLFMLSWNSASDSVLSRFLISWATLSHRSSWSFSGGKLLGCSWSWSSCLSSSINGSQANVIPARSRKVCLWRIFRPFVHTG